jgi:epoxide hydrolase A/B
VVMCHGFPESWRSWRHQLGALAAAGWRAAAPDMRGYGGTDAPADPDAYTMLHHVADMVDLVKALGEREAVIVGHDWGAPAAWNAALLRPDVFRAVAGLSVPYAPPTGVNFLSALECQGVTTFYMQVFQEPGVAEAEFERDPEATLRRITFSMSGDGPGHVVAGVLASGAGFLDATVEPDVLPAWLSAEELAETAADYRRTGFRGGLNWYRAIGRTAELMAAWKGCPIRQPSLFVAGTRDDVLRVPGAEARLKKLPEVLLDLRGCHLLAGAGHWVQRERGEEVSKLLIEFLRGL